jgi:hypothetical protein
MFLSCYTDCEVGRQPGVIDGCRLLYCAWLPKKQNIPEMPLNDFFLCVLQLLLDLD